MRCILSTIISICFLFSLIPCQAGVIRLDDEGTPQGYIAIADMVGDGVTATKSGIKGTITIPGTSPGGSSGDIQYNNGGNLGGIPELIYDDTNKFIQVSDKFVICNTFTATGINAAIDALGAEGGEVYLPEGTYVMTDATITIDQNNTTLTGAGAGTILDWSAGQNGYIDTNDKTHATIRDIYFLGNAGGGDAQAFIGDADDADYLIIQNCWFVDSDMYVILTDGDYVKIIGNHFQNNDTYVVVLYGDYNLVDGNTFSLNSTAAIYFSGAHYNVITNNTILQQADMAIHGSGSNNAVVSDNMIGFNSAAGIYQSSSCHRWVISNNNIQESYSNFIDIDVDGDYSIIIGNRCTSAWGNVDKGISVAGDYCIITGNITSDHDVVGIEEVAGAVGNLFYGNVALDATPYTIAGGSHGIFYHYGDATLSGNLAVNGGSITSTGDITLNPTGNDVILDNANLQIQGTYDLLFKGAGTIEHEATGDHYTETFNNDADTGWWWKDSADSLNYYYDGTLNFLFYSVYNQSVIKFVATEGSIIGTYQDANWLDDSTHGAASTPMYIGNEIIVVENTSPALDGTNFTGIPSAGVTNNVSATAVITDHTIVRGHGGAKVVQGSGITIDDSDNVASVGTLGSGAITSTGASTFNSGSVDADFTVNWNTGTGLFVQGSDGSVGIGTASPGETLEVAGNIAVTGTAGDDVYIFKDAGSGIRIRSDSLTTQWWAGDNGPAYFGTVSNDDLHIQTNNNNRITIKSGAGSGNVGIGVTDPDSKLEVNGTLHAIGVTTLDDILAVDGGQIAFPAAVNASADANTLDDYEEGIYTVAITCGTSGTVTTLAANNVAAYTKVGRVVHVQGYIGIDSVSSPVGHLRISLPFAGANSAEGSDYSVGSIAFNNYDYASTGWLNCEIGAGVSFMYVVGSSDNGALTVEQASGLLAGDYIMFQLTYITG